jgi:hypothetical protein
MQNWRARYDAIMADTEDDAATKGARLRALGAALRAAPAGDPALAELIAISLLTVESDRLATAQDSSAKPPAQTR